MTPPAPERPARRWPPALTRLGLGVSGPHATPLVTRAATRALVRSALAAGVGLFDTAPFYGPRAEAEQRLADGLRGVAPARVLISTKVGTVRQGAGRMTKDFTPAGVAAQIAESQARFAPEHAIGAVFLHGPAPELLTDSLLSDLAALRAAGAVGLLGVCGRGAELHAALASGAFDLLMCPVGPSMAPVLTAAAAQGVGVLAIETLRAARPALRTPRRPADLWTLAKAVRALAGPRGEPGPGVAGALALPAVIAALTTTTRITHLRANAAAASLEPPADQP